MAEKLSVLITGTGGGGTGETCLQALKLAKTPYRIIATDTIPASVGLFQADKGYIVPPATAENYIDKIIEVCKKENVKALVTGSEPELMKISENREIFKDAGVRVLLNTREVIDTCQDKWKTYNFLKKNKLDTPECIFAEGNEPVEINFDYPAVIKPARGGGGSRHAYIVQDKEELDFFVKYLRKYNCVPMIQQYIGTMDDEYTVGVLTGQSDGKLMGSIAVKRQIYTGLSNRCRLQNKTKRYHGRNNEQLGLSTGISQGDIDNYETVLRYAEKVAEKIDSRGPLNIQCRKEGDKVYTFEINPRFSGTSSIRALVGYNEIDLLIRKEILGEKIEHVRYKYGTVMRGLKNYYASFDELEKIKKQGFIENKDD